MSDVTPQPIVLKVFKPVAVLQYADQATVDRTKLQYWESSVSLEGLNTDSTHEAAVQGQYLGTYVNITFETEADKEAWMLSHPALYPDRVKL